MTAVELEKKAEEYAIESGYIKGRPDFWITVQAYIAGHKQAVKKNGIVWHDLRKNPDDLPKVDSLVRVRLMSGMEHICETYYYEPSEDEIGHGKLIRSFYELDGEWIDDTEIIAWCELPKFEVEE